MPPVDDYLNNLEVSKGYKQNSNVVAIAAE